MNTILTEKQEANKGKSTTEIKKTVLYHKKQTSEMPSKDEKKRLSDRVIPCLLSRRLQRPNGNNFHIYSKLNPKNTPV